MSSLYPFVDIPDCVEDGIFAEYQTDKIDYILLSQKRIYLKQGVTTYHPVQDIYKEMRFIRRHDSSCRTIKMPISAGGNVSKGGGKFTPRYAVLNNGWKIIPQAADHTLYITGEQITDDGQSGPSCLDTLPVDEFDIIIQYEPPAAELIQVGGGTPLTAQSIREEIDNNSTKLSSILSKVDTLDYNTPLDIALAIREELSTELNRIDALISSRVASGDVVNANIKQVNDISITGIGQVGNEWRPL